ncbi:MAG: hypothetical protein K0S32_4127 [Bacteroidetes bacterium]|nr:hypothetical protein [Bacteroidota bacterium]
MKTTSYIKLFLFLLSLVMVFHLLVLTQVISYTIVWAGKLNSVEEMIAFESVSMIINAILMFTLTMRLKNLKRGSVNKVVNGILWAFVILFILNTIGNLFSKSKTELIFGTIMTITFTFLCWMSVRKQNQN